MTEAYENKLMLFEVATYERIEVNKAVLAEKGSLTRLAWITLS